MYKLYHHPYSQHGRRVIALLEAAGLKYQPEIVALEKGEHMSERYLRINPNHQVPTLVDGQVKIHESNAILRYLCEKHGLDEWYPADLPRRAAVEQWLDWNQCRLGRAVTDIVLNKVFLQDKGDAAAIERGRQTLAELTPILESTLKQHEYLAGETATIADLSVGSNIFQLGIAQEIPQSAVIGDWFAAIMDIDGFKKSLPPQ